MKVSLENVEFVSTLLLNPRFYRVPTHFAGKLLICYILLVQRKKCSAKLVLSIFQLCVKSVQI